MANKARRARGITKDAGGEADCTPFQGTADYRWFLARYRKLGLAPIGETLYALPREFSVHDLWFDDLPGSPQKFERSLSEWCEENEVAGFFRGQPVPLGPLDLYGDDEADENQAVPEEESRSPNDWINDEVRAYAGWLVTNRQYRKELAELKTLAQEPGALKGPLHEMDMLVPADSAEGPAARTVFASAYRRFCLRWCLARLISWDIPDPLRPILPGSPCPDSPLAGQTDLGFFVPISLRRPWQLLSRANVLKWQEAAVRQTGKKDRWAHLADWLKTDANGGSGTAAVNYADMFFVWFYWRVLADRYAGHFDREATHRDLHVAFALLLPAQKFYDPPKSRHDPIRGERKVRLLLTTIRKRLGPLCDLRSFRTPKSILA